MKPGRRCARFYIAQNSSRRAADRLAATTLANARGPARATMHPPRGNVPGRCDRPTELAAWTAVSRVLLNLDETITRE